MMLFKRSFGLTRSLFTLYVHEFDCLKKTVIPGLYLIAFVDLVPIATEKVSLTGRITFRSNIIWNWWKSTLKERSIRVNLNQGTEM